MYPANELTERTRKQLNRETIADSVKAKMPASSGVRRFSKGKFGERPLSHGAGPSTSRSLNSPLPPSEKTQTPQQIAQRAQQRPSSHQRPSHDGGSLLRRQSSEELVSSHAASFVPRPPSRQKTEGRPKSAKGRMHPGSQVGRENIASRESLSGIGEQVFFPPPLKPQLSFSKYKPLPSISTRLVPGDNDYHSSSDSLLKRTINDSDNADDVNSLSQKTAGLSLQYSLPDEPTDTETERIHLAIKLLDGSRHERWFRHTDTLGTVLAFASSISNDKLPPCQICTSEVPRRVFDNFSVSLSQAKINSRTVLYLEDVVP